MPQMRISAAGVAAALLHLTILGITVSLILTTPAPAAAAPGWTQRWFLFLALDFPVSLGVIPVAWLVPPAAAGPLHDVSNFWWPLVWHGVVGTAWWYVVGWAIAQRFARARARQRNGDGDSTNAAGRSD